MKGGGMVRSRDYEEYLVDQLRDPEQAEAYLNAALQDGDPQVLLLALRDMEATAVPVRQQAAPSIPPASRSAVE